MRDRVIKLLSRLEGSDMELAETLFTLLGSLVFHESTGREHPCMAAVSLTVSQIERYADRAVA